MCVIVYKEKNKELPSEKILQQCWQHNPHGAGFMFNHDKKVHIVKGLMTFKKFIKFLNRFDKEFDLKSKSVVIHFRIGTSGGLKENVCHPFPLANNYELLNKFGAIVSNVGIAHNGVISGFGNDLHSDTQEFIKEIMYPIYKLNRSFYKDENLIRIIKESSRNTNKFAIMDSYGFVKLVGNFQKVKGYWFSNTLWQPISMPRLSNTLFGKYNVDDEYDQLCESDDLYEYMRDNLIELDENEVVYGSDDLSVYQNDTKNKYGYDPFDLCLYIIDDDNKKLSLIDRINL